MTNNAMASKEKILYKIGISEEQLEDLWDYLPSGWSTKVRNAKSDSGVLLFTKMDGIRKLDPAQVSRIKALRTQHMGVLEYIVRLASLEKDKHNNIKDIINK